MSVFSKVYNKLILIIVLLFVLYINLFLISKIYDVNNIDKEIVYLQNKYSKNTNLSNMYCKLYDCKAIKKNNIMLYYDKGIKSYKAMYFSNNIKLNDKYYLDLNNLSVNIKIGDEYFYIDIVKDRKKIIFTLLLSSPLILLILILIILSIIKDEQKESIIKIAGNEALLTNKSMIMITENIHHELNTPLEVIDNKVQKLKRKINKLDPLKLVSVEEDFDFIDVGTSQIRNILKKMRSFKELRYSKKDENLYEIFDKAFKMISLSIQNYEYSIDKELNNFRLDGSVITPSDIINIIMNHLKNSLEADASKIHIIYNKKDTKLCYIRLIDNGTGIPEKFQKRIFEPNFSTKSESEGTRGNGMYLNHEIMRSGGGNIKLIDSTNKGTTIELEIPVKNISKENKDERKF